MDIDRFLARHEPTWTRLAVLTDHAGRGQASAPELDELISLYQRTGAHLSVARRSFRDPALHQRLTTLIAEGHAVIYGTRPRSKGAFAQFFAVTFPVAVWSARRFIAVAAVLTFVPTVALATWMNHSDRALEVSAPASVREAYLESEFEDYYSSQPAAQFASTVFFNNVKVGIMAFAAGIAGCVLTAFLLAQNGLNLGFAAGLFINGGQSGRFFGLILPHGLLELSAVIVAGAAGLRLGWTLIDPGDRRRVDALAHEGRRSVSIVMGLVLAFGVAGAIEGFITGSSLPTLVRVGVGVTAFVAFWLYVVGMGSAGERRGLTGTMGELEV
jgi:uncharacterized membrane protein SpoIIM required for sporulation